MAVLVKVQINRVGEGICNDFNLSFSTWYFNLNLGFGYFSKVVKLIIKEGICNDFNFKFLSMVFGTRAS